jgi:hypothetical protein
MTYNFDYYIEKDGNPYLTTDKAAKYISDYLFSRVTSDKPVLESRVAEDLLSTSETILSEEERQHILSVIVSMNVDNYAKGKLMHPLIQDADNGVPVKVTRWQLRAQLAIMSLEDGVTSAIMALPTVTPEEQALKIKAQYAWDYANYIERESPTVAMIQVVLGLTNTETDDIFVNANLINI